MIWRWLDAVAHRLYRPGRRCARVRWWHAVHLIPGSWLAWVCDRHEAQLLRSLAAGEVQWDGVTAPRTRIWRCDHASISGTGLVGRPTVWCGCEMAEV